MKTEIPVPLPVTAPAPLSVNVNNFPNYGAPKVRTLTLSPDAPNRMEGGAMSLTYLSGDLPFVAVHFQGQYVRLFMGQTIDLGGAAYALENSFLEVAQVTLAFNARNPSAPPEIANLGYEALHNYSGSAGRYYPKEWGGFAIYNGDRERRLKVTAHGRHVAVRAFQVRGSHSDLIGNAPAGTILDRPKLVNARSRDIAGYHAAGWGEIDVFHLTFTWAEFGDWTNAAGISSSDVTQLTNTENVASFVVPSGTALFVGEWVHADLVESEWRSMDVVISDMGRADGQPIC